MQKEISLRKCFFQHHVPLYIALVIHHVFLRLGGDIINCFFSIVILVYYISANTCP